MPRAIRPGRTLRGGPGRKRSPADSATGLSTPTGRYCSPGMADGRKEPRSKYTEDRGFAGAFEGETVTRRRMMTLTAHGAGAVATAAFLLPALGFAVGTALFERPRVTWQPIG